MYNGLASLHEFQGDGFHAPLLEPLLHILVHFIRAPLRTDFDHLALLLELVDDGHACFDKHAEPLLDALEVVVCAARRLAAVEQAFLHDLFRAIEEQSEL